MRVLVLGSSGFVGRHVVQELARRGAQVESWSRAQTGPSRAALHRRVDLLIPDTFAAATGPWDAAVLLAGHAVPGLDFTPQMGQENVAIAANSLAHLARHSPGTRVVVMSSAHVYGNAGGTQLVSEDRQIVPAGEYGASKFQIEQIAAAHAPALDVAAVRCFHLIGPRMPRGLLIPDLLERLAGTENPMRMRGPDGVRDFLDVRDGARAIVQLLEVRSSKPTAYNLCSGRGERISRIVSGLVQRLDPKRDVLFVLGAPKTLIGSPAALALATGWTPQIPLDTTLDWIASEAAQTA
jgi:nucleoside-diphosphate-sugar epimerase